MLVAAPGEPTVGKVQVVRTRSKGMFNYRFAAGCPRRKCWSPWQKRRGKAVKKLKCKCEETK